MDPSEQSCTVLIYNIPFQDEGKAKFQLIEALSRTIKLQQKDILLQKKENKFSAYLTVSSTKCKELTALKELTFQNHVAPIRKYFADYQIFINKLFDSISIEEAQTYFGQFGRILLIEEQPIPHIQGVIKSKARHCYIKFDKNEDAQKCLMFPKSHFIKKQEVRVVRNYKICQNQDTDKKIFLKITPPVLDIASLEEKLNNIFIKYGYLRQKIRIEPSMNASKSIVIFTSCEAADCALKQLRDKRIDEKYQIFVRPFANKESHFVFLGGLRTDFSIDLIQQELEKYGSLVSCTVQASKKGVGNNVIAAFANQSSFKRLLAEYREDKSLAKLFLDVPYVTIHMSAKERKDFNTFMNGKCQKPKNKLPEKPAPIGFNQMPQFAFQRSFIPPMYAQGNMFNQNSISIPQGSMPYPPQMPFN